jgi:hypothetical protein
MNEQFFVSKLCDAKNVSTVVISCGTAPEDFDGRGKKLMSLHVYAHK